MRQECERRLRRLEGGADILVCSHTSNRNLGILFPDTPRLAAISSTGKRTAQSIGSLLSALRQKDLSPRPPLLRGEGESNEALRKHEKGRQECLPHLHTRILNGSTSLYAGVALIDWRIKQLNVTIACINQAYHLRKRADP